MVGPPVNPETVPEDGSFFRHWVCGTFFGWLAGLAIIIAGAVVGDLVGTGEADYQFIVGLGMGVTVLALPIGVRDRVRTSFRTLRLGRYDLEKVTRSPPVGAGNRDQRVARRSSAKAHPVRALQQSR